jgi:hypothetical protein
MSGTVTMRSASATPCATNETPSVARARLFGYFFNVGSAVPTSHIDDVFATVQLYRSSTSPYPPGTLRVAGIVGRCTDASCNRFETLGTASMGTVEVDTPLRLSMYWRGYPYYAFSMTRRLPDQQQADDYTVTIPFGERHESISPDRRLEVSSQIAHCSPQRAMADGVADFDEVYVDY